MNSKNINNPIKLIEDLIGFFHPHEICDYMCGSGTTKAAADKCGIASHLYDLHSGFDIMNSEIPERPEFIFWHPPYWDIVVYSDVMYKAADVQSRFGYDPRKLDLSRIPEWSRFVEAMNYAMMKQFTALEKGGRMAVLIGDIKKKGKLYSMLSEIVKPGTLENIIIKAQQKRAEADVRDLPGATWRDIVASVMEEKGEVPLSYLYEQIEPYKKAKQNRWWKEKVRQTLQIYPTFFRKTERGLWLLKSM